MSTTAFTHCRARRQKLRIALETGIWKDTVSSRPTPVIGSGLWSVCHVLLMWIPPDHAKTLRLQTRKWTLYARNDIFQDSQQWYTISFKGMFHNEALSEDVNKAELGLSTIRYWVDDNNSISSSQKMKNRPLSATEVNLWKSWEAKINIEHGP